jgi:D-alanyl-D-alanine-carboxypeptidase/D-alanyl-D-alanine-endopeptidase
MRLVRSALPAALAILIAAPLAAQHFPSNDSLTALIRARVGNSGVGMVLGVLEPDGSTRIVSYGTAGTGAKALGPNSVFEMGSITKVFTGILLADLVDKRLVSLDDPIAKYLPAGTKVPSRDGREITLLDIATHRSSLTRMPTNMTSDGSNPYPNYTIGDLYAFLGDHQLRRDIGSEYEYSNIAVALLGHIIERVAGKSYEQLVQDRILKPLGMRSSSTVVSGTVKDWLTIGHDERRNPASYRGWATLPAMGALRSNAEDMLKFIAANVGPADNDLERAMRLAHQPRNAITNVADIGLLWSIQKYGTKRIIGHGGATQGFRAYVAFDPETRVGAVALANYPAAMVDIVHHLIHPAVPLAGTAVAERTEIDLAEPVLLRYVGEYELHPTFVIGVTLENGGLFAEATNQAKQPIFPESETKFFYKGVNAQLEFLRDSSGAVTGVNLHQNARIQHGQKRATPGVQIATDNPASFPGSMATITSKVLGGDRRLRIVRPAGYELSQSTRFPVMYVVEGPRTLHHASAIMTTRGNAQLTPQMIVVNVTGEVQQGEQATFAKFLAEELHPWVTREYRTAPLSLVVGPPEVLASTDEFSVEISVPDNAPLTTTWRGQQHTSTAADRYKALVESMRWVFDGFRLPNIVQLAQQPGGTGLTEIDAHFAKLSERYGYRVVPLEDVLDNAAGPLVGQRRFDDAVRLLEKNRDYHPGSAVTWNHIGDGLRFLCRYQESKENYTKARDLARAMSYGNLSNYEMELARVTQELESGKQCTPPGATRP